jgi:hypothetical protein
MPSGTPDPSPPDLAALQSLLDRSTRTAGPAAAESLAYPSRQMRAAELIAFWRDHVRLVAMTTVGADGAPHTAPVHARLEGTTLRVVVYDDALRRRDVTTNPRVAFTTWGAGGAAVILYGRATEVPGSLRDARPGRSGKPRKGVELAVRLTRAYAMRAPDRDPA